jgi:hypothetical protein
MTGKTPAPVILLVQSIPLDHRPHRAVKYQDAPAGDFFQLLTNIHTEFIAFLNAGGQPAASRFTYAGRLVGLRGFCRVQKDFNILNFSLFFGRIAAARRPGFAGLRYRSGHA